MNRRCCSQADPSFNIQCVTGLSSPITMLEPAAHPQAPASARQEQARPTAKPLPHASAVWER
jgi:hypothetical protein